MSKKVEPMTVNMHRQYGFFDFLTTKEDSYNANDKIKNMKEILNSIVSTHGIDGAVYVLNTTKVSREKAGIDSLAIVVLVELALVLREHDLKLDKFSHAIAYMIQHAKELADLYSYALKVFVDKNKIPIAIRKGIALAFNNFSEQQFKDSVLSGEITFRDLMKITHPKAIDIEHSEIFKKIMSGTI